jgi:flavin-binding protein dodecin
MYSDTRNYWISTFYKWSVDMGTTYKIIELVGTSDISWEEAATTAVETAGETLKDLRIAEVSKLDMIVTNGKVTSFRARVNLSFKYQK